MRVRIGLLGLTAGAALAFAATAANADAYRRGPGPSAACCFSWSGFYIGGHAGVAWSEVNWNDVSLTGEPVNNDSTGFIGGGQIGYNWQFGSVVVGVEGTFSGTSLNDDYRSVVNPAVTYSTDINSIGTVTGRLGFAGDRWLVYAKGGWATAQVDVSGRNPGLPDSFSISDRRNGWTVGTGFEYMATRNLSLGLEYSYIDLGSESYASTTALAIPFTITDADAQIHSVTARLNYRFHRDEPRPLK